MFGLIANACCARPPDKDAQNPAAPSKPTACQLLGAEEDAPPAGVYEDKPQPAGVYEEASTGGSSGNDNGTFEQLGVTDYHESKNAISGAFKPRQGEAAGGNTTGPDSFKVGAEVMFAKGANEGKWGKVQKWGEGHGAVQLSIGRTKVLAWLPGIQDPAAEMVLLSAWNEGIKAGDPVEYEDAKANILQGICKTVQGKNLDMRVSVLNSETGKATWVDAGKWTRLTPSAKKENVAAAAADPPKEGDEVRITDNLHPGKKGILEKIQDNNDELRFKVKCDGKVIFAYSVCKAQHWDEK